ncbi:MAG: hypothetical protein IAG13_08010 [Deltaproteobacteria bacterium]|nr:hypothetical protein [Nannocystaceae bacterium]
MTDDTDAALKTALDQIWADHQAGKITTLEYNTRRRELKQAHAKGAAAATTPPTGPQLTIVPPLPVDAPPAVPSTAETPPPGFAPVRPAFSSGDAPSGFAPTTTTGFAPPAGEAAPSDATLPSGGASSTADAAIAPAEPDPEAARAIASTWGSSGPKDWGGPRGRGDDPSVRIVHAPTGSGIGDGKSFLFMFGLRTARETDQKMTARELEQIVDDVEVLRAAGFTVVVDPQGGKQDFLDAIYGQGEGVVGLVPAGIYWSAHGHDDGRIECCDGQTINVGDIETAKVSPGLRLMVFGACYTGAYARTWRTALGGHPLVVGWGRPVTIDRAVEFLQSNEETDTDFDDLVARYVLDDQPIPPLPEHGQQPSASSTGRKDELTPRIAAIADLLGAVWREQETYHEVRVMLPNNRRHVVRVFITLATQPFFEGRPLIAVESEVGELSDLVEVDVLLNAIAMPGFARVNLVRGRADLPDIVVQGFLPHANATDTDVASLCYQVAQSADELELEIFGSDRNY